MTYDNPILLIVRHPSSLIHHSLTRSSTPKVVVKNQLKTGSFWLIFVQFLSIFYHFLSKKYKKTLIFTLIFMLKTNKSYKIILYAVASRPIFKISPKITYFLFFLLFFTSFFFCFSVLFRPSSIFRRLSSVFRLLSFSFIVDSGHGSTELQHARRHPEFTPNNVTRATVQKNPAVF